MSLEDALAANTAAVIALTKAMAGGKAAPAADKAPAAAAGKGKPAAAGKPAAGKGKAAAPKSRWSADDVRAILIRVKDEIGLDEAKTIISEQGEVEEMAAIKAAQFDAVVEAAYELLGEEVPEEDAGGDGL